MLTATRRLAPVVDEMVAEVDCGLTAGSQLCVIQGDDVVVDKAIGDRVPSVPMTADDLFNVYCGLKPVVALAVLASLETVGVGLSTTISSVVEAGVDPEITIGDVLSHDAGLVRPGILDCFLGDVLPDEPSLPAIRAFAPEGRPATPAYSETAGWALLDLVCAAATGRDLRAAFAAHVGGRPGLAVALPEPVARAVVACYVDTRTTPPIPMLHDQLRRFCGGALGGVVSGYASMRGLARWYRDVLTCRGGVWRSGFPSPSLTYRCTVRQRPVVPDLVLRRECSFGFGFMTDLASHGFGGCPSSTAFGHAGFLGNSFAFADPEHDLVVAFASSGLPADRAMSAEVSRPVRIHAIYDALGLT